MNPAPLPDASTDGRGAMTVAQVLELSSLRTDLDALGLQVDALPVLAVTQSNGLTLSGGTLALQLAGAAQSGAMGTGSQSFSGAKTFASLVSASLGVSLPSDVAPLSLGVQALEGNDFSGNIYVRRLGVVNAAINAATGRFQSGPGTASATAFGPYGDDNTGLWFPAGDTLNMVTGGVLRYQISGTGTHYIQGQIVSDSGIASSAGSSLFTLNESFMKGSRGAAKWSLNEAGGGTAQLYHTSSGVEVGSGSAFLYNGSGANGLLVSTSVGARLNYGGGVLGAGEFVVNQVAIRSSLGASSGDQGVLLGYSTAAGSVNSGAKLISAGMGIGGSYTEKFYVTAAGALYVNGNANTFWADGGNTLAAGCVVSTTQYMVSTNSSTAFYAAANGAYSAPGTVRMWSEGQGGNSGETCLRIGKFTAGAHAGARLVVFGENVTAGTGDKSAVMGNGDFEHFAVSGGIVLRSPDGTRWRLTVSNAGASVWTLA